MEIRIGHSPDPDDAFMFHAMTTGAFSTPGLSYVHQLQDIETLNHRAMAGDLEVSAAIHESIVIGYFQKYPMTMLS